MPTERSVGSSPGEEGGAAGPSFASNGRHPRGLLIPPKFSNEALARSPRVTLQHALLQQPGAKTPDYAEQIGQLLDLLRGRFQPESGQVHVVPGERAGVQVWLLGSSGGQSAAVAGRHGLRFAANYHVSPSTVLEAVDGYRAAFRPSPELPRPYVIVSADVVVAKTEQAARELASGYGLWVRSIRRGAGAIEFPTPAQARAHVWTPEDEDLVRDRVQTQFVGSPALVAYRLEQLREATGADELLITTITHAHSDRVRSYELLAEEWRKR